MPGKIPPPATGFLPLGVRLAAAAGPVRGEQDRDVRLRRGVLIPAGAPRWDAQRRC